MTFLHAFFIVLLIFIKLFGYPAASV